MGPVGLRQDHRAARARRARHPDRRVRALARRAPFLAGRRRPRAERAPTASPTCSRARTSCPHFTAYENVAFALRASGEGAGSQRDPEELLGLVGLDAKLDSLPAELSGGEAQRVAIARALGQRPDLLLCDEPTGHLDSDTGRRVLDLVDALQEEFGFALVLATHDSDVAARASRIVSLVDGRVVAEEAP